MTSICKGSHLSFAGITALLLAAGCAVGPNFKQPAAPEVGGYTTLPLSTTVTVTNLAGGTEQRFIQGLDIPGDWWRLFHSQPLNDLIQCALTNNPNIKAAQAALKLARENVLVQKGAYYPSVNGGFAASRQRQSEQIAPTPNQNVFQYNLFTPQVSVSYVPDVFGLNRRSVESLTAQADQQRYVLAATYITLSANIVAAAVQEASLRAQIAATRDIISVNTTLLDILHNQVAKGYASRLDLAAQEAQLAQVESTLPPLLSQLAQQHDVLAVLAGEYPNQETPEFDLASLQLPVELPVSLPSRLVAQRPDVRQAGENLHFASAQIGVAVANRIPNITLTANAGSTALALDQVFTSGAGFWAIGGTLAQPVFEGGALLHKEHAARAAYVQAAEQYRAAVQTAFQNVADTLNALQQDGAALQAAAASTAAAKATMELTRQQIQAGYTDNLTFLPTEQAYQQAVIALVQAQANRYADTAALFQALGGGWWNCPDLSEN